jgi:hypothetical protein
MRKLIHSTFAALALAAAILSLPTTAGAVGYEDSLDDCRYPEAFDVLVMRPLSFTALLIGSAVYVASAPIWVTTVPRQAGTLANTLMGEPARFTFSRGLGECSGLAAAY